MHRPTAKAHVMVYGRIRVYLIKNLQSSHLYLLRRPPHLQSNRLYLLKRPSSVVCKRKSMDQMHAQPWHGATMRRPTAKVPVMVYGRIQVYLIKNLQSSHLCLLRRPRSAVYKRKSMGQMRALLSHGAMMHRPTAKVPVRVYGRIQLYLINLFEAMATLIIGCVQVIWISDGRNCEYWNQDW